MQLVFSEAAAVRDGLQSSRARGIRNAEQFSLCPFVSQFVPVSKFVSASRRARLETNRYSRHVFLGSCVRIAADASTNWTRAQTGWNGHKRDCFWNLDPGTRHPPRLEISRFAAKDLLSPSHRQQLNCSNIQRIAPSAPNPPNGPPGCSAWSDIAPLLVEIVEEPIVFGLAATCRDR